MCRSMPYWTWALHLGAGHRRKTSYLEKHHRTGAAQGGDPQGQERSSAGPLQSEEHSASLPSAAHTLAQSMRKISPERAVVLRSLLRDREALLPVRLGHRGQALPWKVRALQLVASPTPMRPGLQACPELHVRDSGLPCSLGFHPNS